MTDLFAVVIESYPRDRWVRATYPTVEAAEERACALMRGEEGPQTHVYVTVEATGEVLRELVPARASRRDAKGSYYLLGASGTALSPVPRMVWLGLRGLPS